MRRFLICLVLSGMASQLAGCAMFHELQPHRLHRWNRGPAPSMDPEFLSLRSAQPIDIVRAQGD